MPNCKMTPESLREAIEKHFKETPADEIVRRAEKLRPPPESEPLGMLPEGFKSPFDGN
ncbi:MAG: hypothetical protein UX81_C0016G0017 [Parcubacteria group bacterium GW2011_GWA2_47_12]|nr:MAG: hypothetical protein UX81_C0016G0017 [Parcubacteria group bacterium GW2011_GWA2_47_12]